MNAELKCDNQTGFSLIELLVVLVIIGLLVTIAAPQFFGRVDDARVQKVRADFKSIGTALKIYRLDNQSYPTTEQGLLALTEKPSVAPEPRNWKKFGYLEEAPLDPWGRSYLYINPAEYGKGEYDLYSLGADGVSGGEGQDADIFNGQKSSEG